MFGMALRFCIQLQMLVYRATLNNFRDTSIFFYLIVTKAAFGFFGGLIFLQV
jgi:hypothetical protein